MYEIVFKRKIEKAVASMPAKERQRFQLLTQELTQFGPIRSNWPNYGMIVGTRTHHCHLSHKWVACWVGTEQGIQVEVTYVGSRESAPYAKN